MLEQLLSRLAVIRSDQKEKKVGQNTAKDRNAWKSFLRSHSTHVRMEKRN